MAARDYDSPTCTNCDRFNCSELYCKDCLIKELDKEKQMIIKVLDEYEKIYGIIDYEKLLQMISQSVQNASLEEKDE